MMGFFPIRTMLGSSSPSSKPSSMSAGEAMSVMSDMMISVIGPILGLSTRLSLPDLRIELERTRRVSLFASIVHMSYFHCSLRIQYGSFKGKRSQL